MKRNDATTVKLYGLNGLRGEGALLLVAPHIKYEREFVSCNTQFIQVINATKKALKSRYVQTQRVLHGPAGTTGLHVQNHVAPIQLEPDQESASSMGIRSHQPVAAQAVHQRL